jgi:hypothetical protein
VCLYKQLVGAGMTRLAAITAIAEERNVSAATLGRYIALVHGKPAHTWIFPPRAALRGPPGKGRHDGRGVGDPQGRFPAPRAPGALACIARLRELAAAHPEWVIPATRTLQRRLDGIPRVVKTLAREGTRR